MTNDTKIAVTYEVTDELSDRKRRGESYDNVLRRLLNLEERPPARMPSKADG
jgi:predicted CopG family antitoxin